MSKKILLQVETKISFVQTGFSIKREGIGMVPEEVVSSWDTIRCPKESTVPKIKQLSPAMQQYVCYGKGFDNPR